jgi:hypothetical protein
MAPTSLRLEDKLDSASNFVPWKARVTLVLMENELWEFANTKVTQPTDPKDLATHELKDVKARRIILNVVKDHLILHTCEKKSAREMFVALTNLFSERQYKHKDGVEREAQRHQDDQIRYGDQLSHQDHSST